VVPSVTGSEEISVVPRKAEDFASQRCWPAKSVIRSKIFSAGPCMSAWDGMSGIARAPLPPDQDAVNVRR